MGVFMNTFFYKNNKIIAYISFFIYASAIIFLYKVLISYNPTDSSWLYVISDAAVVTNYGGVFGAHIAAILFYLLGGASFLLLLPVAFFGLMIWKKRSIRTEWERLGSLFFLVCLCAIVLAVFAIDCASSPYPGGMVGLLGAQKLLYYFDPVGRLLFLLVSICASLILLFQWSFICIAQLSIAATTRLYKFAHKHRIVHKIAHGSAVCLYSLCIRFPVRVLLFIQSLLNGTAFDDTGLLHPQDDYDIDFEFPEQPCIIQPGESIHYLIMRMSSRSSKKSDESAMGYKVQKLSSLFKKRTEDAVMHDAFMNVEKKQQKKSSAIMKQKKIEQYALPYKDIFIAEKQMNEDYTVEKELQQRAHILEDKLKRFGVNGHVTAIKRGPVVTLFEYQPDVDTKLSKIIVLEDDLAMALQAMSIRIIAPIPGRSVVGFEVSNTTRHDVLFSQIINQAEYTDFSGSLPLVLGKGTVGEAVVVDLARMPHLLIAGSTGSGKSVALNAILISLLCKLSPDALKLILIDPKRLEFAAFTDIPHLLFPIVTSPAHAAPVLRWVVQEMEERYEKMAQCGARNITDYNMRILLSPAPLRSAGDPVVNDQIEKNVGPLPYIVVMIDELADLMITAGRDIEDLITRITQMARAAGIHMIVATQRPSVDVITGLIKANFPSRISFRVASRIDSRTILDTMGADRLLGRGDMLFLDAATSQLRRVHGAYVSDKEIEQVADHIRQQRKVEYLDLRAVTATHAQDLLSSDDVLYKDVQEFLNEIDEISISLLQRKFRIGYNRSARIIDMLESQGLIMPQDGGKTRKVIR